MAKQEHQQQQQRQQRVVEVSPLFPSFPFVDRASASVMATQRVVVVVVVGLLVQIFLTLNACIWLCQIHIAGVMRSCPLSLFHPIRIHCPIWQHFIQSEDGTSRQVRQNVLPPTYQNLRFVFTSIFITLPDHNLLLT